MVLEEGDIAKDERRYLQDNFHGLRKLTAKDRRYLELDFRRALWQTLQIEACFSLCLASCLLTDAALGMLLAFGCFVIIAVRLSIVVLLGWSVMVGKLSKRMYERSLRYWAWWPGLMLPLCCLGALCGGLLGHYLWRSNLHDYYLLERLQVYRGVDPSSVPGEQIQDAGIVSFSALSSIDRSRGGCLVNDGHTYCVAPIVHGGAVLRDLAASPQFGSYDYFAVGVDCCNCPNQDFRCGEYFDPLAHGGIRSLDYKSRPFYQLAVDDWIAIYGKAANHPLFFEWTAEPEYHWQASWYAAARYIVLGVIAPIPISFILLCLLGKVLQYMESRAIVSRMDTPPPPLGLEKAWEWLLPDMRQQYLDEQKALLGLRTTPMPWYAASLTRGQGSAGGAPQQPVLGARLFPDGTGQAPGGPVSVY
mmetsp:Transcript_33098/g.87505  ORF Transcript_33098/g.87505 Transcript_33098/m.87505 type:complete len:418 (-) Transcript_33098:38-1291(-)